MILSTSMLLCGSFALSTEHFRFNSNTGSNATVAIPLTSNPNYNGTPIAPGDEIGVFTSGGLCVGATAWDGLANIAITVWGDNTMTPEIDGIRVGELMLFHVWHRSTDSEYSDVRVTYSQGSPGNYTINGTYILSSLIVLGTHTIAATAGENGSITPEGLVIIGNGMSRTFTIAPDSGYRLDTLLVDGVAIIPSTTSYTFTNVSAHHTITATFRRTTVGYAEDVVVKELTYALEQNYPNPFNPSTTIRFRIPIEDRRELEGQMSEVGRVAIKVFDVVGREIATLIDEVPQAGEHAVVWNAGAFPSGVYIYRLSLKTRSGQLSGHVISRKMIFTK